MGNIVADEFFCADADFHQAHLPAVQAGRVTSTMRVQICPLCKREYSLRSLPSHLKSCAPKHYVPVPSMNTVVSGGPSPGLNTTTGEYPGLNNMSWCKYTC